MNRPLKIAMTKGRLVESSTALFEKIGLNCEILRHPGRKLILDIPDSPFQAVLAKAPDVITYVESGVCDLGIVGKDTIMEAGGSFYELLDLGFGKCRFALAVPKGEDFYGTYRSRTIATKYPNVARAFFARKGMDVNLVKIEGSVELAPLLGLSDGIVDIVETGATLYENGLIPIEDVAPISARLIVNSAALKMNRERILTFVEQIRKVLNQDADQ